MTRGAHLPSSFGRNRWLGTRGMWTPSVVAAGIKAATYIWWRLLLTLAVLVTLSSQHAALAAPVGLKVSGQITQPAITRQTTKRLSDDLSAAVRVRRGETSFDVLLVTPLSVHWAAAAASVPLHLQMRDLGLPPPGQHAGPRRIERILLPPVRRASSVPRMWRTKLG